MYTGINHGRIDIMFRYYHSENQSVDSDEFLTIVFTIILELTIDRYFVSLDWVNTLKQQNKKTENKNGKSGRKDSETIS